MEGGYLLRHQDPDGAGFHDEHRRFVGPTLVLTRRVVTVRSTTQYEWHLVLTNRPNFNRYRERIEMEKLRQGISPFVSTEVAFHREGLARSRSRAGVRWRFRPGCQLELAYQFESLRGGTAWVPRHVLRTAIHFGRRVNGT